MKEKLDLIFIGALGLIFTGAFVRSFDQFKLARSQNLEFSWADWVLVGSASIFTGWLFYLGAQVTVPDNPQIWGIMAGLGSYAGQTGLAALSRKFLPMLDREKK